MKGKNIARIVIGTLFVLFLVLYFTQTTGYYEYEQKKLTTMTEEQVKKFEEDVNAGKNIDLKDYLTENKKDYHNKISNVSLTMSQKIEDYIAKGIEKIFSGVEKVVTDS